jgi:AraC-like DNA-binding protein
MKQGQGLVTVNEPLPVIALSTQNFDPRTRVQAFETAAASICKLAIEPASPDDYASSTTIKILPGAVTARTSHSASVTTRTRAMAADEGDNLLIHIPLNHGFSMAQRGGPHVECKVGELYLDPNEVAGRADFRAARSDLFYVSVPRAVLAQSARALNGRLRQTMQVSPQWRMFIRYAQSLDAEAEGLAPHERAQCCAHLHELVQLALNADDTARHEAKGRGVRAARLRALKAGIDAHASEPGLSLAVIAAAAGISERYARALFAEDQTTFRDCLTRKRMQILRRMLADPEQDKRPISDLVMAVGFGDLSWFNKCYRQIYNETPSESRARLAYR